MNLTLLMLSTIAFTNLHEEAFISGNEYPATRGFSTASPLACTLSFACLVFRVVGLFTSLERIWRCPKRMLNEKSKRLVAEVSLEGRKQTVNAKYQTRERQCTRKGLAVEKPLLAG